MLLRTVNKVAGNATRALPTVVPRRSYRSYLSDKESDQDDVSASQLDNSSNQLAQSAPNMENADFATRFSYEYNHGPISEHSAGDVNPNRSQLTHPDDNRVYKRFGARNRESFDNTATPDQQVNYVQRRVVENIQNLPHTVKLVGDAVIQQGRLASLEERLKIIFKDDARPFLDSTTRTSPIYRDVKPQQRMPRVLLPNDTATGLSPTSGILHAYRMQHIRMHMIQKRKKKHILAEKLEAVPELVADTTIKPIEALDDNSNEMIQEYVEYFYHMARLNANPRVAAVLTEGLKDIIPLIVKVDTKEVVQIRKRKK